MFRINLTKYDHQVQKDIGKYEMKSRNKIILQSYFRRKRGRRLIRSNFQYFKFFNNDFPLQRLGSEI